MLPASSTEKGQCVSFPDVCKTPVGPAVVPLPYPNMAQLNQVKMPTASKTVFLVGKNAVTEKSEIAMSSGDEAGSIGGVISNSIKGLTDRPQRQQQKCPARRAGGPKPKQGLRQPVAGRRLVATPAWPPQGTVRHSITSVVVGTSSTVICPPQSQMHFEALSRIGRP